MRVSSLPGKDAVPLRAGSLFWPVQTAGWTAFFGLNLVGLAWLGRFQPSFILGYAATALAGFGVTLLVRAAWKPWLAASRNPIQTALVALLTSLFSALLLLAAVSVPELWPWPYVRVVGPSSFRGYGQQYYWAFSLCLAWALIYLGYHDWRAAVERRAETARALAVSESAKLQQVRFRINPAFLFGALEALRARVGTDRAAARTLVAELAEFLRYGLLHPLLAPVPPEEEFQAVRHYLAVRDIGRDGEVLSEARLAASGGPREVPAFLLLLLIEKAISLAPAGGPVRLCLGVRREAAPPGVRLEASCQPFVRGKETSGDAAPGLGLTTEFLRHLTESQTDRFVFHEERRAGESVAVLDIRDPRP